MTGAGRQIRTQEKEFRQYAREILDLVPVKSGRLLDIGCGIGWVVAEATKRGFDAIGIDPQKDYVSVGKKYLNVDLRVSTLEQFSTKDKYDVVILKHVLEHIVDTDTFLSKVKKLLRPGGYVVVACPNINSLMARIFTDRWYGLQPLEHRWQFTNKSLPKLLTANGFKIDKVIVTNLYYNVPGWKGLVFGLVLTIADLTNCGDQVIVVARKK